MTEPFRPGTLPDDWIMMKVRFAVLLSLAIGLAACVPSPRPQPTALPTQPGPAGTVGLPPARTPTFTPLPTGTPQPTPTLLVEKPELGLRPAYGDDLSRLGPLTLYSIDVDVSIDPDGEGALIEGNCVIRYSHGEHNALREIVLMLWPNDGQYAAEMTVGQVLVDGLAANVTEDLGGLALRVALPRPLEANRVIELYAPFRIVAGSFGPSAPQRFGLTEGLLIAPTFYPLIPPRPDGEWQVLTPPPGGDTTNSETALYQLTIRADPGLAIIASGVEISETESGGRQQVRFVSGPMRDVAIAVGPLLEHTRSMEDLTLRAWVLSDHAGEAGTILDAAERQIETLTGLVGPYRYAELDLVDAPGAFGGIEYPGLVYLGTIGTSWMIEPIVHEVAHQWFYAMVGDDQLLEPWLDEAAATYATALYYEDIGGTGRAAVYLSDLRSLVRSQDDPGLPIGLPVEAYASESEYAIIVYFKGALFFDALRHRLGEAAFDTFLQTYYARGLYKIADSTLFLSTAEDTCGCSLQSLFDLWVFKGGPVSELQ